MKRRQKIETGDGACIVPLTLGQATIIDASDWLVVADYTWHARKRQDGRGFYAVSTEGIRMHRLILGVCDGRIVDHRDGDGLNNRRNNIRPGTQALNCINRKVTPGKYLRGVRPNGNRWRASIARNGKQVILGNFSTERQAHDAYVVEAIRLYGDWFPLPPPPKPEA